MNRRTFIGTVAAGSVTATVPGCLGGSSRTSGASETVEKSAPSETRTATPTATEEPPAPYMVEMGERVLLHESTTLRLESPISTKKLEFENGETRSAPEGKQFILVKIVAESYKDRTPWFPIGDAFVVKEGTERYWSEDGSFSYNTLTYPVSDEFYVGSLNGKKEKRSAGQLLFTVPEEFTSEVAVALAIQPASVSTVVGWEGSIETR